VKESLYTFLGVLELASVPLALTFMVFMLRSTTRRGIQLAAAASTALILIAVLFLVVPSFSVACPSVLEALWSGFPSPHDPHAPCKTHLGARRGFVNGLWLNGVIVGVLSWRAHRRASGREQPAMGGS